MSTEEKEWTIAALRRQVADLEERVADLEARVARPHNCLVDSCDFDGDMNCLLAPRDAS